MTISAELRTFNVVLIEPEIPQNTGNIGRTCVATASSLHLVGKMGFEINDKNLKRAGLDYWPHLSWKVHSSFEGWWAEVPNPDRVFFIETTGQRSIWEPRYQKGDWFVFGKETIGLDKTLLQRNEERVFRIPQYGPVRSLNVATAVAITLFEAHRQIVGQ